MLPGAVVLRNGLHEPCDVRGGDLDDAGAVAPIELEIEPTTCVDVRLEISRWESHSDRFAVEALGTNARGAAPGPEGRLARLKAHFDVDPVLLLIGEAPGYQGCHYSGVAFTNEALLLKGSIPRMTLKGRITSRLRPWCEPSATVVWGALHANGLAERTVLWNAFAWHPHRANQLHSNRTPTEEELRAGRDVLEAVVRRFRGARLIAVGKVAARTLTLLGYPPHEALRHPSMGGANEFRAGLAALARSL